jgi:hypothetical protein
MGACVSIPVDPNCVVVEQFGKNFPDKSCVADDFMMQIVRPPIHTITSRDRSTFLF